MASRHPLHVVGLLRLIHLRDDVFSSLYYASPQLNDIPDNVGLCKAYRCKLEELPVG